VKPKPPLFWQEVEAMKNVVSSSFIVFKEAKTLPQRH
jgi:hypothetical protein